jgi:hypothetical protein
MSKIWNWRSIGGLWRGQTWRFKDVIGLWRNTSHQP